MTTKQADRLIGQSITVVFPKTQERGEMVIQSRRSRSAYVEAMYLWNGEEKRAVLDCKEFEIVK